jgi:enoyl-CoA hydratase/carnithine racemase
LKPGSGGDRLREDIEEVIEAHAEALAKKITEKSAVAARLCMDSVLQGMEMSKTEALKHEANILGLAATTADAKEGVEAFLEKRKPSFQNR